MPVFARLVFCGILTLWSAPALAQTASEPALRAAFILNFMKFTDWPAEALAADAPVTVCVADGAVASALTSADAKSLGGRPITVLRVSADAVPRTCAVLYVSQAWAEQLPQLFVAIGTSSVLSIGDSPDFNRRGGIVRLFVEGGAMRFSINVTAAERARLRLSSRLLALAEIVRD